MLRYYHPSCIAAWTMTSGVTTARCCWWWYGILVVLCGWHFPALKGCTHYADNFFNWVSAQGAGRVFAVSNQVLYSRCIVLLYGCDLSPIKFSI